MKIYYTRFVFFVTAAIILIACSLFTPSSKMAISNKSRETGAPVLQRDVRGLVDGNNAFAFDVYRSLRSQDGNLILSPYSISLALAMPYAGARNETESQMAQALHFLPQEQFHSEFNALDQKLEESKKASDKDQTPLQLDIVNAIWAEQTQTFLPEFLDTLAANYGAGIYLADFINQFESARKEINSWVKDQTKNKVKNVLAEGSLDSDTRMVLVNTIYFKADWLHQFESNFTRDAPFHLLDGSTVNTPRMNQEISIPYASGNGFQAVELPYSGSTAAMDIIVPDDGNFDSFESSFDSELYDQVINGLGPATVALGLPKFEFSSDFNLSDQLAGLGMSDAFDSAKADFSGMTGGQDLFISDVVHKAFVAVDEKGTEAAAATITIMGAGAMPYDVSLIVDRPFIFVIRDLGTGQILFFGRVLNPLQ